MATVHEAIQEIQDLDEGVLTRYVIVYETMDYENARKKLFLVTSDSAGDKLAPHEVKGFFHHVLDYFRFSR